MSTKSFALALPLLAIVACTAAQQSVEPQKTERRDKDEDDDDDDPVEDGPTPGGGVVDAATGGAAVTYRGTLSKTPSTQFGGGSGHCRYNVVMGGIELDLAITPEGNVIGGSARNTMTESVIGTCAYAPIGTKPQSFSFASTQGQTLTWAQAPSDGPKTALTLTLAKIGTSYQAAVKWARTDRTDDLAWTVNTTLALAPK